MIMFLKECWFYLSVYVNSENVRWWSTEYLSFFVEELLYPQIVGVRDGICRRRLVGLIGMRYSANSKINWMMSNYKMGIFNKMIQ